MVIFTKFRMRDMAVLSPYEIDLATLKFLRQHRF